MLVSNANSFAALAKRTFGKAILMAICCLLPPAFFEGNSLRGAKFIPVMGKLSVGKNYSSYSSYSRVVLSRVE